jgi:hypothetical protein
MVAVNDPMSRVLTHDERERFAVPRLSTSLSGLRPPAGASASS